MDFERAIETQRVKLLRLLTGWVVMLGVLSGGPLALPVPRWVCAIFQALLVRAELGAQYLIQVSAFTQTSGGAIAAVSALRPPSENSDTVPSAQSLLQRMCALRNVLENLPRHARRMLRVKRVAGEAFDYAAASSASAVRFALVAVDPDWIVPRVERPPDKLRSLDWCGLKLPLALRAGDAGV